MRKYKRKYIRRKTSSKEYKVGTKIEYEHKPTLRMIKNHLRRYKRLPTLKRLATSIARDHINESSCYYNHPKYGLVKMEKYQKRYCRK